jgi:hypothetical protein
MCTKSFLASQKSSSGPTSQLDVVRNADSSVIGVKHGAGSCTDASFPDLVNAPEGHRSASLLSNAEYQRHVLDIF